MIYVVIVFESLVTNIDMVCFTCKDLQDIQDKSSWYFENRKVISMYITNIGVKNEEN